MFDHQSSATVMNVFMNSTIAILVHCREHVFTIFISKRWKTESESAIIGFVLMSFCKLWVGGLTNLSCSHICCFMMNGNRYELSAHFLGVSVRTLMRVTNSLWSTFPSLHCRHIFDKGGYRNVPIILEFIFSTFKVD